MEAGACRGVAGEEMAMRKGPWMAEEDEILMDYVKKHGPRDWSSIRSKGLLPRTGKSCRLRWVNKLKPDLKTGCKFSAEEERVVIDLQARFGNKWARIATYLQGRTDNDVKNFWSTRQKRLARMLQTSNQPKSHKSSNGKSTPIEVQPLSSRKHCSSYIENHEVIKMMPLENLMTQPPLQLEYTPVEKKPCIEPLPPPPPQPQFCFPPLPPLLPESQDLVVPGLMDVFVQQDDTSSSSVNVPYLEMKSGNGVKGDTDNPATPDSFFDDFPADMFDYIESLPTSSEW